MIRQRLVANWAFEGASANAAPYSKAKSETMPYSTPSRIVLALSEKSKAAGASNRKSETKAKNPRTASFRIHSILRAIAPPGWLAFETMN